ncbi:MAG: flagellar biosynthesis anti-sigma factor FlgM [Oscillospiraceae bacterium]|nr:flagellar biosynthesis anti-sigma factor FlgM [Oscillospiraceae bacterium]
MDVASVSEDAKSFSRILSELRENETIRSPKELERIREITSLVNRGAYQADSRAIADRILSAYAAADEDI